MNFAAKSIKAPFVEGLEELSDERLVATLREVGTLGQIDSLNWAEYPYAPAVSFRIAHSDKAVAIMFEVRESNVKATTLDSNGPVWEDSCVEFFVKNPLGEGCFNFEINCIGTALAAFRHSRSDAEHFSEEKIAKVRRFGSLPHATIDINEEGQSWWLVEVVPFELLGLEEAPDHIEANFYKCGDKCAQMHFLSWSPIALPQPNFHCPEFFGRVELARD
ncbi:MAG: hypothetical protein J6V28_03830 [Tidjanibacter sp.]|nr:hypothetical protein [Tidjanibacter sp.]